MLAIESVFPEHRVFMPSTNMAPHQLIKNMEAYRALCKEVEEDYVGYWGRLAAKNLVWHKPFTRVLDESNAPFFKWFDDGELNVSYNCLDRHILNGQGEKIAIIFESDDGKTNQITYQELYERVCQYANALRALGVKCGDRVVIYLPMSIEGVVAMQACVRIGAIHSVVFGGFSAKSLGDRIADTQAVLVITADQQIRGGKTLALKETVDEALAIKNITHVKKVIVYRRTNGAIAWNPSRDIWLHEAINDMPKTCEPTWVNAEHPLFILYTSGSTGIPKGIQHSSAGYLLWVQQTMYLTFDYTQTDIFWCTADIGWITGHSYICYGPLAVGATQLIFEGVPHYPNAGRFWEMIARHKVNVFYTAPTAIRALIKAAEIDPKIHPKEYNLSSLRIIGTVGEPINPQAWMWYYENVGSSRCPIADTFWQTETGGHVIGPIPGVTPLIPGSCTLPLPGIVAAVVDEKGQDVPNGHGGQLVIKRPWPGMLRNVWGDPERYKRSYFPDNLGGKLYLAGDGAMRDEKTDYFVIMGRMDDVLNVSGHRMGTMEIESALIAHPLVAEAAVVGRPDETTGEAIVAFIILNSACPNPTEYKVTADILRNWIGKQIGSIAKPKDIRFGDSLPKTRSGKIMRRLLRDVALGKDIKQDVSTLENPEILEQLKVVI